MPQSRATALLVALCLLSALVALPRVLGQHSAAYQAIAHLYVGGLAGAFLCGRKRYYLVLAVILSVVEVASFLYYGKR